MTGERLRLIQGGKPYKTKRQAKPWKGCHICAGDTGQHTRMLVRGFSNPDEDAKGNIVGGRRVLLCAFCLARGKVTPHTI